MVFFLIIFVSSFGKAQGINPKEIIYKTEINATEMKLADFLFFLSKEGAVEIAAEKTIQNEKIDFYSSEGSSLEKILMILCESNEWKAETENGYIFISPRNVHKEGRGTVTGKILSAEYKKAIEGAKITLLDDYSKPCYSNKDGSFRFENIPYGVYFIRAEKNGCMVEGEIINVNKNDCVVTVYLEKEKVKSSVEKDSFKKNGEYGSSENDFVIEKIKFSDVDSLNFEEMVDKNIREGVKFSKNSKKGIIYISGNRKKVYDIKNSLEKLDSFNKQVRITAQILDVTDNLFEDLGFSWLYGGNTEGNQKNSISVGVLTSPSVAGIGSVYSSVFNMIRNFNNDEDMLQLSFNLLQGTQDLTISAIPSIVTTNGKEGVFKTTEEKIIGQERVENDENSKTTYTPIFKEAGIILKVVPEILENDYIVLNINLETSDFKMQNYVEDDEDSNDEGYKMGGSKISRNLETTVKLKSGDTVFIGGLKKGMIHNAESRIPFISSVPVVGMFFKNSSKRKEITDLYIRLKVDIVKDGGFEDAGMDTFYGTY